MKNYNRIYTQIDANLSGMNGCTQDRVQTVKKSGNKYFN